MWALEGKVLEHPRNVAEEYLDRPDMIPPLSSELFRLRRCCFLLVIVFGSRLLRLCFEGL